MPMFNPVSEPSFRLDVAGLPAPLEVLAFTGKEALNEPYVFDIELLIDDALPDLASLMHRSATLYFGPQGNCISGQLQVLVQRDHGTGKRLCQVRLGPKLTWLAQRFSQRIFSACSVPQILDQVLKEHGIIAMDRRFDLDGDYAIRDFCTQYQESDLQFFLRLCAEERLHFHFEHRAHRHCLVFGDDPRQLPLSELAEFRTQGTQPAVRQFQLQRRDDSTVQWAQCQTDVASLRSGQRMTLLEHPLAECNHCWLLTHVEHQGSQDDQAPYRNLIRALDVNGPFESLHSFIKPRMYGLQRAWVVEVDELRPARDRPVPVQFDWIYQGEGAAPSHCWLPMADPLQSATGGLLQEGTEVVVSFIDGDPDRPMISGLFYQPQSAEPAPPDIPSSGSTVPPGLQQWLACAEPLMLLCLLPGGGSFNHCTEATCTCRAATRLSQSGRS
jgi:type VI secretion system secreted protein VgrG